MNRSCNARTASSVRSRGTIHVIRNDEVAVPANFGGVPQGTTAVQLPDNGFNNYFLQVFGKSEAESACECERSPEANLAQSLHLINSPDVQNRLQNGNGLAARFAREQVRPDAEKVNEIYLRAFCRQPIPSPTTPYPAIRAAGGR